MKYRQSIKEGASVGLEITPAVLRAVEIKLCGREATIQHLASATMPAGSMQHGRIVDPGAVATALRQLWEQGRFSTRRCTLAVPVGALAPHMLTLPPAPPGEQRRIVAGELSRFTPIDSSNSPLGWMPMAAGGGPGGNTLAFLAESTMIAGYRQVIAAAGLELDACEPDSMAALRVLEFGPNRQDPLRGYPTGPGPRCGPPASEGSLGATAAVFVSDTCSEIAFLEAGRVRYYRRIDLGLDELTGVSAAERGSGEREPEDDDLARFMKSHHLLNGHAPEGEAGEKLRPLLLEIQRSLQYYGRAYSNCPQPQKVQLLGDYPPLERLAEVIQAELHLEAEYPSISDFGFSISDCLTSPRPDPGTGPALRAPARNPKSEIGNGAMSQYSVALGLALRPLSQCRASATLNLSARDEAEVLARHAPRYLMAALSGSTALVLVTLVSSMLLNARLSQVQDELQAASAALQQVNTERATSARQLQQARMETARLRKQALPIPRFLTRLGALVPESVAMTNLELRQDGSVTLQGEAQTPQQVNRLLQQLSSDTNFRAALLEVLDSSGQGGTTHFTVQTGLAGCGTKTL
jgi:Tfp pilus assembly PilM family ATPase